MIKKIIGIGGMTCASCAQNVEKSIKKLDGIEIVSVNLAAEKAAISYNPDIVRLSVIREAVEKAGYKVIESGASSLSEKDKERKQKEIKTLRIKLIVSAIFSLTLLYISMVPMITIKFISLPLSHILHNMMINNPVGYALIELCLVIPVIGAGYKFYAVGYKSLLRLSPNMDSLIAVGTTSAMIYSVYNTWQIIIEGVL